jgi:hypothetical protein
MLDTLVGRVAVVVSLAVAAAALAADEAPPAAPTFDGWTVKTDDVIPAAKVAEISKKLGGKLTALRNTVYDVKGEKIQINVMAAADAAEADKLVAALTRNKAAWSVARKGTTIYEFVGGPKANDAIKKASATLSGS